MESDLQLVVQLQSLDQRIAEVQREISELPKHIAVIEKTLDQHLRRLEADRAALAANQRDRKKLESDIQVQEQKISKLKSQMLEAKTNEQYRAFQHEIEFCEKEIRRAEDRILELMSESEPLERNVKAAEESLKGEKQQVEAEKKVAQERTAKDRALLEQFQSERQGLLRGVTPSVYNAYERIRKKRNGIAVAEAVDGRCSACHLALRPQFFQDLKIGAQVMFCESCGRILYYNPPVSFEDAMDARPDAAQSPPGP